MRLPLATSLVALAAVFFVVLFQSSRLPRPSKAAHEAYTILQEIAREPHPYNSRRIDVVREYVRSMVEASCPSALDESDNSTAWISHGDNRDVKISTYFEQTNLVFYLPSRAKDVQDAVLMSAHYDSVSSGNGATDDGVGVTVLMSLIAKYCKHSLPANLVFNINAAEEDGLFGAQAFLTHSRMEEVKSFVNLEGAGAGGKAVLFRVSGAEAAKAYSGSKVPLASVASNDFFRQRLIKSETDFVVYDPRVPGLDIAFYEPRALYHTRRDSTRTTSAWSVEHMLSAAETSMVNLAHTPRGATDKRSRPLFLDFLGVFFYTTTLSKMLILDLVLLIASPILLGTSFAIRSFVAKIKIVGVGRTLGSLVLQAAMVTGLTAVIASFNPYIVHSSPLLISATLLLGSFTANLLATRILISRVRDRHDLSRVMSWELCCIWYVLLFISAIVSLVKGFGTTYIVTLNFVASLAVALLSLFERSSYVPPREHFEPGSSRRDGDQESDESSPLLRRDPLAPEIEDSIRRDKRSRDYRSGTTWILKYLIFIPVPALVALWLLYSNVLPGLAQTLPDGSSAGTVYAAVGFFAVLTFFNLAPFFLSTSLSSALPALLLLLVILTATSVLKAPFDVKSPLKLYFRQTVDLDAHTSVVAIEGLPRYLNAAVSDLALAADGYNCSATSTKSGLGSCTFRAPVDRRLAKAGIKTSVRRNNLTLAASSSPSSSSSSSSASWAGAAKRDDAITLTVDSIDTRICDLSFDRLVSVREVNDRHVDARESRVRLYRRDWSAPFVVVLGRDAVGVDATVTCFWDDRTDGKVQAFDVVQAELPEWAELVKRDTGLIWYSKKIQL